LTPRQCGTALILFWRGRSSTPQFNGSHEQKILRLEIKQELKPKDKREDLVPVIYIEKQQ
jgi:hypothetical protein